MYFHRGSETRAFHGQFYVEALNILFIAFFPYKSFELAKKIEN